MGAARPLTVSPSGIHPEGLLSWGTFRARGMVLNPYIL